MAKTSCCSGRALRVYWALVAGGPPGAPPVGLQGRLLGRLAPQWAAQAASTRARVGRRTMPAPSSGASWLAAPRPHTTARFGGPEFRVSPAFAVDCLCQGKARLLVPLRTRPARGGCDGLIRSCGRVNRSWRFSLDVVTREVETHAGISANLGKTRVFNYEGGPPPPGIAELGTEVWRGDRPPQQCGFVALGTPIGMPEYVRAWGAERLETEDALVRQLPKLPDLQCAWLLLLPRRAPC